MAALLAAVLFCSGLQPALASDPLDLTRALFFPLPNRHGLGREQREIKSGDAPEAKAGDLIRALLDGSRAGLAPVFPPGVHLRQVFVDQTGRALVDLKIDRTTSARDAAEEALGLFALVNTLCYNLSEVNMVKFLVDGAEASTALGHVDISRSFLADESLVDDGASR
ncbi:MAG: GerMN domain-containing protein [Pseudomonadota bacterium]